MLGKTNILGRDEMNKKISVSPSLQDYLKTILNLHEQNGQARVTDIAEALEVAKSSVHQAMVQLVKLGLVLHEKYGPLELTEKGLEAAQTIKDKHQVLIRFFVQVLGVDEETAQKDACLIEHSISPVTMANLIKHIEKYA